MNDDDDDIEKYLNRNQNSQNMPSEPTEDVGEAKIKSKTEADSGEIAQIPPQASQQSASSVNSETGNNLDAENSVDPGLQPQSVEKNNVENSNPIQTTGQEQAQNKEDVPKEIQRWNWGAFFLTWIWGIGNNVWIALLSFIPGVGFIMAIVLGIKGSEWAWKAKKYNSVEEFKNVQKKWSIWGLILFILFFLLGFASGFLSVWTQMSGR